MSTTVTMLYTTTSYREAVVNTSLLAVISVLWVMMTPPTIRSVWRKRTVFRSCMFIVWMLFTYYTCMQFARVAIRLAFFGSKLSSDNILGLTTTITYGIAASLLSSCKCFRAIVVVLDARIKRWLKYIMIVIQLSLVLLMNGAIINMYARLFLSLPFLDAYYLYAQVFSTITFLLAVINLICDLFFIYKLKFYVHKRASATRAATTGATQEKTRIQEQFSKAEEAMYLFGPIVVSLIASILYAALPDNSTIASGFVISSFCEYGSFLIYANPMMVATFSTPSGQATKASAQAPAQA